MTAVHLPYTQDCFVCGVRNPHGLQLRFRFENDVIHSDFTPRAPHAGYKGIVHGGIVATALDEVMFWAAAYVGRKFYVSVDMQVRWSRKVAVGERYLLVGRSVKQHRVFFHTAGEVVDAAGQVCASATGRYYPLPPAEVPLGLDDFCFDPATLAPLDFFPKPMP